MGMITEAMPVGLPEGGMSKFETRWMRWPNSQSTRGLVSSGHHRRLSHTSDRTVENHEVGTVHEQ